MAGQVDVSVFGSNELIVAMKGLEEKLQKRIMLDAMRPVAKSILATARTLVPVDTGALRDSLRLRTKTGRGFFSIQIGTSDAFHMYKGDQFYGAFVELGHKIGKRPSRAKLRAGDDTRASVPAHPYLRPALEAARPGALARIGATLKSELGLE